MSDPTPLEADNARLRAVVEALDEALSIAHCGLRWGVDASRPSMAMDIINEALRLGRTTLGRCPCCGALPEYCKQGRDSGAERMEGGAGP